MTADTTRCQYCGLVMWNPMLQLWLHERDCAKNPANQCDCGGLYGFNNYCGAKVCDRCGHHKGLARCFCGWNRHTADPEAMVRVSW